MGLLFIFLSSIFVGTKRKENYYEYLNYHDRRMCATIPGSLTKERLFN